MDSDILIEQAFVDSLAMFTKVSQKSVKASFMVRMKSQSSGPVIRVTTVPDDRLFYFYQFYRLIKSRVLRRLGRYTLGFTRYGLSFAGFP